MQKIFFPEACKEPAGPPTLACVCQFMEVRKSECVNCASSKTAEGKAEIQEISGRIGEIRERIDKVTGVKASGETTQLATSTAAAQRSAYATVGSVVDVRA